MNFPSLFLTSFVYLMIYGYLINYGSWNAFGMGHLICACLTILDYLRPTKRVLFAIVVLVTLLISVEDPGKILEQAFATLPLILGAFIATLAWANAAFPAPTANVPPAERWAFTTVRAATALFVPRRGVVAGNAAEPSGSDVVGVFCSSFMFLVLYYLQCKVGSFGLSGLAHAIYVILLYLQEVKPPSHILFPTVLLVTIFFSGGLPYEILGNFVKLLTMGSIWIVIVVLAVFWAYLTSTHHMAVTFLGWVTYCLSFLRLGNNIQNEARNDIQNEARNDIQNEARNDIQNEARNDRIVTSPARATTVFGSFDAVDSYVTSSCVDGALSVDESDAFFSLDSDYQKQKKWWCCVSWCGSGCSA